MRSATATSSTPRVRSLAPWVTTARPTAAAPAAYDAIATPASTRSVPSAVSASAVAAAIRASSRRAAAALPSALAVDFLDDARAVGAFVPPVAFAVLAFAALAFVVDALAVGAFAVSAFAVAAFAVVVLAVVALAFAGRLPSEVDFVAIGSLLGPAAAFGSRSGQCRRTPTAGPDGTPRPEAGVAPSSHRKPDPTALTNLDALDLCRSRRPSWSPAQRSHVETVASAEDGETKWMRLSQHLNQRT